MVGSEVELMTIEELIANINKHNDPDPDSDWKFGKNYGIMLAISEIEKYREENDERTIQKQGLHGQA